MRRFGPMFLITLVAPVASAQVIAEMTPERIQQAIDAGLKAKPVQYAVRTPKLWIEFDTPFLRVAKKAAASADHPTPSLATPDVVTPIINILAAPEPLGDKVPGIKQVVAVRADGSIVAATSPQPFLDKAQSTRRKSIDIRGVRATFPIAVLEPGMKFKFTMSDGTEPTLAPDPNWFKSPR